MKALNFKQANLMLAENQEEFETLPVYMETRVIVEPPKCGTLCSATKEIPWSMTACFELSDEEIDEIVKTKRIWHTQMLYGHNFQPVLMSVKNPFE